MCGSGTIPIEGALIARRMAPGIKRRFAFLDWPGVSPWMWPRLVAEAEAFQLARCPVRISASDRDQGAIAAARANAERAGVLEDIELAAKPVSALSQSGGVQGDVARGWIVTNPPYGVRIGEVGRLRNLYADLGNAVRRARAGWTLALLSAEPKLDAQIGIRLEERLRTRNGGIPVRLLVGTVPSESQSDKSRSRNA
jgi:23S rRNA G2445 N2-methylase RlmL